MDEAGVVLPLRNAPSNCVWEAISIIYLAVDGRWPGLWPFPAIKPTSLNRLVPKLQSETVRSQWPLVMASPQHRAWPQRSRIEEVHGEVKTAG